MASLPPGAPIAGLGERRALRLVRLEGFLGEVFTSLTGSAFLTGLALWLGAGPLSLGLLVALPFIAQVAQLLAPVLERRLQSRRRFVVPAFALGRLLWLVPAGLAAAGWRGMDALWLAMAAAFAMALVGMIGVNGWTSWMADLVPSGQRARVFGTRSAAVTMATMLMLPLGSLWLDRFHGTPDEGLAHAALAIVAVFAGSLGGLALSRLPDAVPVPRVDPDSMSMTLRLFHRRGFRRVIGLFGTWNFSVGLPAAFWTVYMLQHLRMNFFLIGLHASVVLGTRMLMTRWWSRTIDRAGSVRVLIGSSFGAALIPLLWMWPTADRLWPIWIEAVISGIFWTGFNQAAFLQPIAVLAPAERSHGLALYNICTGAALFVASMLGGAVLQGFGTRVVAGQTLVDATGFYVLFALSTLIRLFVAMLALRLTEPDVSLHRFLFDFLGNGILHPRSPAPPQPGPVPQPARPERRRPARR